MADEPTRESERHLRREERLERARGTATPQRVRVLPRDDAMRKLLKHPASGGFRPEGSIEWPLDQFTKRRLRDGDVTIEQAEPEQQRVAGQRQTPEAPEPARASKPPTS